MHAYALGARALEQLSRVAHGDDAGGAPPQTSRAPEEKLEPMLERLHERPLKPAEKRAVMQLERMYGAYARTGMINMHALIEFARRVNPGLLPSAHREEEFFADVFDRNRPPRGVLEFWEHLAVVFRERGWHIPSLLAPVSNTAALEARIAERRRARELEEWTRKVEQLGNVAPGRPDPVRRTLRLCIAPKALRFQASNADGSFSELGSDEVNALALFSSFAETARKLDTVSLLLLGMFQECARQGSLKKPSLRDPCICRCLARALQQPELEDRIVNADGQPFVRASQPLVWHFALEEGASDRCLVELRLADGGAAPQPLLHLGGPPHVYLSENTVFTGPATLHDRADAGWKASLSAAVLNEESVIRSLVRSGARLPGEVEARIQHIALRPLLRGSLGTDRVGAECLQFIFTAVDATGQRQVTFTPRGWTTSFRGAPEAPSDGRVVYHETDALGPALEHFQQLHCMWEDNAGLWVRSVNPNTPHELHSWLAGFPNDTIFELSLDLAGLRAPPVRAGFALHIEESGRDWFDVELVMRSEDTEFTAEELAVLLKAQGRWVRLARKGWQRLTLAADEEREARLAELGLSAEGVLPGRMRFHALQLAAAQLEDLAADRAWEKVQERARAIRALPAPDTPHGFVGELRPYQQEGFHFLTHLASNTLGGILADDMGLGKTVQALVWLLWLSQQPDAPPLRALVVCPKSVMTNWERETVRFTPALTVGAFRPKAHFALPDANIVVANYAQLRAADDLFLRENWTAVILDEAQNIKNPQSQTAGVARKLRAVHRLVLTGTPIENHVLDLWSLFAFAMPGLLGGQTQFKKLYDDRKDPSARARLARRVRHFLLRRTKAQVASDLPPRIEEDVVCELEGAQKELYQAELKRARQLVLGVADRRQFDAQRFNILQSLLRLRQICCHPGLLGDDFSSAESAKVSALFDQLGPILEEGHKVLVFSQFVSVLEILRGELERMNIAHLMITGQTENRQELVDEFQGNPEIPVFLLSLKAAGSGLNLTAASYVVLFDPWWNPAVETQAIDRTHRIGQSNQVIAYRLIAKDTVEEKIRRLQQEKAALARAVLGEESLASVLDLEDLRYVLG